MRKESAAPPILSPVQPIRVGSGAGEVGSTAPWTYEPHLCARPNVKKYNKSPLLYILTFVAALQCLTLVATTILMNETLSDLNETTTPSSRPMTSGPMMWVSRPGKRSSMLSEDKAIRAVPAGRLEGQKEAVNSVIREVFNKVFKSGNQQLLLRMEILVMILSMVGMCGVLMLMQANAQAQGAG